jgi:hypothetical protein
VILRLPPRGGKPLAPRLRLVHVIYHLSGESPTMGKKKQQQPGPQQHAEGQHGEKTHRRFVEQLQEGTTPLKSTEQADVEGRHRLHQDREQHDEAEKNSEKVEAFREIDRGNADENVLSHARVPRDGDGR